jgi:hypothetical protein
MSLKDRITLVESDRKTLNDLAVKYHYMHKPVFHKAFPFGWSVQWDGNTHNPEGDAYGFIIYSLIHYTKLKGEFGYPGLPTKWQVLSLSRLWLHDDLPRNSETCVIGKSLKMVQKRWLEIHPPVFIDQPYHIVKVISYADMRYFSGTIYRAANFREVKKVKSPARNTKNRGAGMQGAELICFIYDLKIPSWNFNPE